MSSGTGSSFGTGTGGFGSGSSGFGSGTGGFGSSQGGFGSGGSFFGSGSSGFGSGSGGFGSGSSGFSFTAKSNESGKSGFGSCSGFGKGGGGCATRPSAGGFSQTKSSPSAPSSSASEPAAGSGDPKRQDVRICPQERDICLSSQGLAQVAGIDVRDFTFIVDGANYKCSRILAGFLSPKVARMLQSDINVSRMVVNVSDPGREFKQVMNLVRGGTLKLEAHNTTCLMAIANELQNRELLAKIVEFQCDQKPLNPDTAVDRLKQKAEMNLDGSVESRYIAENFTDIDFAQISQLRPAQLEYILTHSALSLDNEDSLLDTVDRLCQIDRDYCILYRTIEIQYLSSASVSRFCDAVFPDLLDGFIWEKLQWCVRDRQSKMQRPICSNRFEHEAEYTTGTTLNGIFARLHTSGKFGQVVRVTSVGTSSGSDDSVTRPTNTTRWTSTAVQCPWLCFEFKGKQVCPTHYELRVMQQASGKAASSTSGGTNGKGGNSAGSSSGWGAQPSSAFGGSSAPNQRAAGEPTQWVIEGSNDNKQWVTLDSRNQRVTQNEVHHFEVTQNRDTRFQFLRMRLTYPNGAGAWELSLTNIDFYGSWTS